MNDDLQDYFDELIAEYKSVHGNLPNMIALSKKDAKTYSVTETQYINVPGTNPIRVIVREDDGTTTLMP